MLGTLFLFLIIVLLILGVIFFFTPKQSENKKEAEETTNWEYQKEQSEKESKAEIRSVVGDQKNKEWFAKKRWLTDKEIDWACERLSKNNKFKILPAHQFHYVKEAERSEVGATCLFLIC